MARNAEDDPDLYELRRSHRPHKVLPRVSDSLSRVQPLIVDDDSNNDAVDEDAYVSRFSCGVCMHLIC